MAQGFDDLIVRAGSSASVLAERLASERNRRLPVVEERPHSAGAVFNPHDENGVLVHRYEPRPLHTDSERVREEPKAVGDPYYPIARSENSAFDKGYKRLAQTRPDMAFVGRLATYRYDDMDRVAEQTLNVFGTPPDL